MSYHKIIFINITTNLLTKAFKYWELVKFLEALQNSDFLLKAQILPLARNVVYYFPWSGKSTYFWESICPVNTVWILNNYSLPVSFSSKMFHYSSTCNSNNGISAFPRDNSHTSYNAFCMLLILSHGILKDKSSRDKI